MTEESRSRFRRNLRFRSILVFAGSIPLLVWQISTDAVWPDVVVSAYVQAAVLFGVFLTGSYPPRRSRWFVKSMGLIFFIHLAAQIALAMLALGLFTVGVHLPTRIFFGLVGVTVMVEGFLSLRIIWAFEPGKRAS